MLTEWTRRGDLLRPSPAAMSAAPSIGRADEHDVTRQVLELGKCGHGAANYTDVGCLVASSGIGVPAPMSYTSGSGELRRPRR